MIFIMFMPSSHKDQSFVYLRLTCYCLLLLALHCPVQLGRDGDNGHVAQPGPVHLLHAAVALLRSPVHTVRVADLISKIGSGSVGCFSIGRICDKLFQEMFIIPRIISDTLARLDSIQVS